MNSLSDILLAEPRRQAVTADCVKVIEDYVAGRGGLKGIAMKTGLTLLRNARPDLLTRVIGQLLPEIVATLEPSYAQTLASGRDFETAVLAQRDRVAAALVGMADRRMQSVKNTTAKSMYKRLSGDAETEISAALPALSRALAKHLPQGRST